jgi:hypothetical protein
LLLLICPFQFLNSQHLQNQNQTHYEEVFFFLFPPLLSKTSVIDILRRCDGFFSH